MEKLFSSRDVLPFVVGGLVFFLMSLVWHSAVHADTFYDINLGDSPLRYAIECVIALVTFCGGLVGIFWSRSRLVLSVLFFVIALAINLLGVLAVILFFASGIS